MQKPCLIVPVVWVILVMIGYAFIFWGIGVRPWDRALEMSGSSLLTLGTVPFENLQTTLIEFSEATIGLGLIALLIGYLPTMYSAFSRREALVTMLEVRAGSPPSAVELIIRMQRIGGLHNDETLTELWKQWEVWFTELEESHTSLAPLIFFRSPNPQRSWITAAGTILDAAAVVTSSVDVPRNPSAQLMIRAGYLSLQSISRFFRIDFNPRPQATDPISITRDEFNEVFDQLAAAGVTMKPDRDQAWRDFAGWRVNYDHVLLRLATLTMAPYAPWISDRSVPNSVR